ncbi:MAG TPA: N-acetylmuramoyl-L-alanine amidase [Gaiellaceae bacterium]|nr:N-acetylmuramoyl-L-alanine amidase [Gaiellaceae bacterium]
MSFRRSLLLASLLAALVPGSALAADGMVSLEIPVGETDEARRSLPARPAPVAFEMVGLHWRGSGDVWFRTARERGAWSVWRHARPEGEDQPDRSTLEAERESGWKLGNPFWTGPSRFIQYRLAGRVTRLRAFFLRIEATEPPRALAARADGPAIVRRSEWGANESIVRGTPAYADRVRLSVVHHTAGTNGYSRAQAAGIVRGIQRYHVQGNGWNDIGYNFLVDKYGRIYEGRAGGIARNVIGAHAQGFNTGSVGVAVLGTYGSRRISSAARSAIQRLLAWRLDVAHVDPVSRLTFASYGNPHFPAGTRVRLRAVSGHRDTGSTSCPGSSLYGALDAIAREVSALGLPKLYEPEVSGAVGGDVRFTARLSHSRGWAVTVKDGEGAVVDEGRGRGRAIDWTWDSSAVPFGKYSYVIHSGAAVRPAQGAVPSPPPLETYRLEVRPRAITPNRDGNGERTRITFSLTKTADVTVTVLESGARVNKLLDDRRLPAGPAVLLWGARDDGGVPVSDGRYEIQIEADAGSEHIVRSRQVVVDRTLGHLRTEPDAFSPNGDGHREKIAFTYELARRADVRVQILRGGRALGTIASGSLPAGRHRLVWNGRLGGRRQPDGLYDVYVRATTTLGRRGLSRRFSVDTTRPMVRIRSAQRGRGGGTRLRLSLSESSHLRIWYGLRTWRDGRSIEVARRAGRPGVARAIPANVVRVVAWDAARNRSRADVARVRG